MQHLKKIVVVIMSLFLFSCASAPKPHPDTMQEERPEIYAQTGHSSVVSSSAFSADGRYAVTGSLDATMKLWDVKTGSEIRSFDGHTDRVDAVAFSPDGRHVISGHYNGAMKLWDIETGRNIHTFSEHSKKTLSVDFSHDGQFLLTGGWDKVIRLWNTATGQELKTFTGHRDIIQSVAFSPDDQFIVSGGWDRTIKLWNVKTGREVRTFTGHIDRIFSVGFSPDGGQILSASLDNTMRIWDVQSGRVLQAFGYPKPNVAPKSNIDTGKSEFMAAAYSPDGKRIISGGAKYVLKLWDAVSGKQILSLDGRIPSYINHVSSVAFSPDGKYILSTGNDKIPKLWDASTGRIARHFTGSKSIFSGSVHCLAVSPDGKYIFVSDDKVMKLWDLNNGKVLRTFTDSDVPAESAVFSPDSKYILTGSGDRNLKLWNVESGRLIRTQTGHRASVRSVAFSSDGRLMVSGGSWDKTIKLWDAATGKELRTLTGHNDQVCSVAFSPDGKYILSGSLDKTLKLWDVATGRNLRTFRGHSKWVVAAAFSPDGRYALSGSHDNTIKLWNVATGEEIRSYKGNSPWVYSVAFSPDGQYIVSGHHSGILKKWETASGRELTTMTGHSSDIYSVAFSTDGRYIISGSRDRTTRLWEASDGAEVIRMMSFDNEWVAITPEGYYNSSGLGHKYLQVRKRLTLFSIEQFYDVFYRPDIVSAKLRHESIASLIGVTLESALKTPPPVVEFTRITQNDDHTRATVCYRINSIGGGIGEVRLFHNGKLISSDGFYKEASGNQRDNPSLLTLSGNAVYQDMRSIRIAGRENIGTITSSTKGDPFSDCRDVDLISGENEVSVAAFNGNNTIQSFMRTEKILSAARPEEPHLYILSIGIDRYKAEHAALKYAAKDAGDVLAKFRQQAMSIFPPDHIHVSSLINESATKSSIVAAISDLSHRIKPTDKFILFVAGHGLLLQNQYYMVTHNYEGSLNDSVLISTNEIVEMSKKIKSFSQLFIFDTCHAGGVDYIISGLYDARMSVMAKKMGLHIYASANNKQTALDGYLGNGLFTHALLDGLNNNRKADKNNDGSVSIVGLGEYSRNLTTDISRQIGHEQTPLIIHYGKDSTLYRLY